MTYDKTKEYINTKELIDTVTNGYQYIIIHKDALAVDIPMAKCATFDSATNKPTGNYLSIQDISDELGTLFTPVSCYIDADYRLVHWCFDERKINGLYEQDYIRQLLDANGFQNLRDLNSDGLNDSLIEYIDYDTALSDTTKKYYMLVSAKEAHSVKKYVTEEVL